MVKQNKQNIADEKINLNENKSSNLANYIPKPVSKKNSKQNSSSDDLIVTLSDAYENKRARQVFEWETIRRQNNFFGI